MGWGLPGILGWLPSPTVVPCEQIPRTLGELTPGARILDVGAGGRRIVPGIVTFDAVEAPEVDVVGDIHGLPFADNSFDCVFCTGTLEHVRDPWQAVREIHRVLRPGGIVHIDVPFIQGFHADPTDYWRFTLEGLRLLCQPFEEMEAGVHIGPSCGLVWVAREWADSCCSNRYVSNALLVLVSVLMAPLKYLDYLMIRSAKSHRVASAVFFRGRKRAPEPGLSATGTAAGQLACMHAGTSHLADAGLPSTSGVADAVMVDPARCSAQSNRN